MSGEGGERGIFFGVGEREKKLFKMDIISLCPQGDTFLHICGTKTLPKMVCNVKSKPSMWHFSGKQTHKKYKQELCLR